jgi:hypothetical protein
MKCPKCGAEIPAGSKFCNECGTKIEQVALFKDDESKNTEPCKCESCGNIIPNNSVFCPICHTYQKNKFSPTGEAEKTTKKKPIYRTPHFYIALLIALILTATAVTAISQCSNQPDIQEPVTTSTNQTSNDTSETDLFEWYDITPFSIDIPKEWTHKAHDGYHYFYDPDGNRLYISSSQSNISPSQFTSGYVDSFLDGFANSFDDFEEISRTTTHIDDFLAYRVIANLELSGDKYYGTMYVWVTKNYLCCMLFTTEGDEQSEEFDFYEDIIVNSIITYSSKDVRSPEEDSAEKATEPETEPPTEKPTEFKDTLTELYSDSDIAVYYSDTEQAPYSDEEVDVHFYIKNKMDKSITVQADTVILDGRSYNKLVCSAPISAHSEGMIEVSVKDCKNFNPSTVGADLIYFDTDTYDNDVKMNLVSKKVK